MNKTLQTALITYLRQFATEERWQKINEVLNRRTRYLSVVLEDIYQPHNASAVLRSCDCFGIQDVHIIENHNEFDPNKGVTIGADKWITLQSHNQPGQNNSASCFRKLKECGYRLIATTPHEKDMTIDEISLDQKTALVFGAELNGLSDYALEHADGYARIPMEGFSESFNISVSAALCLYELSTRLRKKRDNWQLTPSEKETLQLEWLKKSVRAPEKLIRHYLKEQEE